MRPKQLTRGKSRRLESKNARHDPHETPRRTPQKSRVCGGRGSPQQGHRCVRDFPANTMRLFLQLLRAATTTKNAKNYKGPPHITRKKHIASLPCRDKRFEPSPKQNPTTNTFEHFGRRARSKGRPAGGGEERQGTRKVTNSIKLYLCLQEPDDPHEEAVGGGTPHALGEGHRRQEGRVRVDLTCHRRRR